MRRRGERQSRVVKARGFEGEMEVPEQHRGVRVGCEAVDRAKPRHLLADEMPFRVGRQHRVTTHRCMRDAEDFCSHAAAELADFPNDHVGPPVLRDRQQVGNHPLGVQTREELPNPEERSRRPLRRKGREFELKIGKALVGSVSFPIKARREHIEPTALNVRMKRRRGRKATECPSA